MLNSLKTIKINLWIPDIFSYKGGIQVYSRFLLYAFQSLYPKALYSIFLKNDSKNQPSRADDLSNTKFYFSGNYPLFLRTLTFSIKLILFEVWQRPDLIITTHLNFAVAAYWLKRLTGIPYCTVAHGIEAWNIKKPVLKAALHNADLILAVSSYTRNRLLREQNLDPNKVSILPNTFDHFRFQPAPKPANLLKKYGLKPEQPVILTVGRLAEVERYKGYDQVLQALPTIRQTIPDVHYILVGKGDDKPRIEQMITQLGLQDCVTLAGFVSDEQLCNYYNLCDVFAMPSKREGFGIVYLEALACGKPVLGGNQDGAIDALCHGELGALVNPDDVEEIAKILIQILQKNYPNTLIYQPEALREKVINTFGFENFKKTLGRHLDKYFFFKNI
ncbi:MAG: glycosyltransferase [Scytonematopsis contorta HA4267-MV1]|jgi:glycosyltransferase involved in cell wall biosynthesis|nr:glycosyltransferase [Scytonematopsis contorta HA4267-MV1]